MLWYHHLYNYHHHHHVADAVSLLQVPVLPVDVVPVTSIVDPIVDRNRPTTGNNKRCHKTTRTVTMRMSNTFDTTDSSSNDIITNSNNAEIEWSVTTGIRNHNNTRSRSIPYEQRITQQRMARRMNHPFKYLYRHGFHEKVIQTITTTTSSNMNHQSLQNDDDDYTDDDDDDDYTDPYTFLYIIGQYTHDQIIEMNTTFPMLLQLSVLEQLYPKHQFLFYTLLQQQTQQQQQQQAQSSSKNQVSSIINKYYHLIPPFYYGTRLERSIAPRHAFLVWSRLPFGIQLFDPIQHPVDRQELQQYQQQQCKFHEFLLACRNTKQFAAMCQRWSNDAISTTTTNNDHATTDSNTQQQSLRILKQYTAQDVEAFEMIFSRGLLAICRNDLVQHNNTWALDQLPNLKAADLVPILISHGSNVYERDHRGATVLHWACGTGHWDIVQALIPYFTKNVTSSSGSSGTNNCCTITTTRDGATPFHWAAAGCNTREFGTGGHVHICERLLDHVRKCSSSSSSSSTAVLNVINQCTYDGNSALMWAAWSGTIETVKLLVRNKANVTIVNRNGCSVAHWAASGGNIAVCQYLHTIANVDFTIPNYGGNTPLSHAVAFKRTDVVEWLLQVHRESNEQQQEQHNTDSMLAYTLAQDFVGWSNGGEDKEERSKILQLFDVEGNIERVIPK